MKKCLLSLLAIVLLFEEWLWDALTAFGHALAGWLHLQAFEQWLGRTAPIVALAAFSMPLLLVAPLNIAAFGLLAHGLVLQGILLELLAKLLGTLLVARVFALTKPQLLTFTGLRFVYTTIMRWLQWAHRKIADTALYRWGKQLKAEVKAQLKTWFGH